MNRKRLAVFFTSSRWLSMLVCLAFLTVSNAGDTRSLLTKKQVDSVFLDGKEWANRVTGELFNTPKQACDDFIKTEFPGANYQTKIEPTGNPDYRRCLYLENGTWYEKGLVERIGICTTSPNGLYSDLDASENFTGVAGAEFDEKKSQQKTKIRNRNKAMNGFLKSDDPDDPCPYLCEPTQAKGGFEKDLCEAEVDHIIPRISNGEPCGTNAYSNARITSKKLNNAKRNDPNFDAKTLPKLEPKCPKSGDIKPEKKPLGNKKNPQKKTD